MTDYIRLSEDHDARRRDVAELLRTVAAGLLLVLLVSVVVFGSLACVAETSSPVMARPVTADELDVVICHVNDRILEARR